MVLATSQQEFSDADWRAVATADQTKKLKLLLSGLTTGTTRVWTVQDVDGTIYVSGGTDIPVADGGTGASTAAGARTNLGAVNIAGDTMTGVLRATGFNTQQSSIADDAVTDFGDVFPNGGVLILGRTSGSGGDVCVIAHCRTSASAFANGTALAASWANTNFTTSDVTGTTGVDGKVTISCTSAHLKIENRGGGTYVALILAIGT